MNDRPVRFSKVLSLVLRHEPARFGVRLDAQGWADVAELLRAAAAAGHDLSKETLLEIVATSDKQRFALSADGSRIRANQGHSIAIDLALEPAVPPPILYHGTASRFLASIRVEGLKPGSRRHVHLSSDEATARAVGTRHGSPAVLHIDAAAMHVAGHLFFRSVNGVWLVDRVPPTFLCTRDAEERLRE
jgi:putative RNA 2'-phosphotransferase